MKNIALAIIAVGFQAIGFYADIHGFRLEAFLCGIVSGIAVVNTFVL